MIIAVVILFIVMNIVDVLSTLIGLSIGAFELNPAIKLAMSLDGIRGLIILKAIVITTIFALSYFATIRSDNQTAERLLMFVTLLTSLVVLWNMINLSVYFLVINKP